MKRKIRNRKLFYAILTNVLFWMVSIIVFGYIFKISDTLKVIDVIYAFLFHISLFVGIYANIFILIPNLLSEKRYVAYAFLFLVLIVFVSFFNQFTFSHISDIILPGYYFVVQFNFLQTFILILLFLGGATVFYLSKSWFQLQDVNYKIAKIEKENIDNQLKILKAQINPHFLFNSLNVLYALALKRADETPETIIKLSDILRYVIYESNKEKVSIQSEVKLINDYLVLQKYRVDKTAKIHFYVDISKDLLIPPMLFLPLVENSFKHGVKGNVVNTFVDIKMITKEDTLQFDIVNNKGKSDVYDKDMEGGIGLKNIQKRLQLLYPEKHTLRIDDEGDVFRILLIIDNS